MGRDRVPTASLAAVGRAAPVVAGDSGIGVVAPAAGKVAQAEVSGARTGVIAPAGADRCLQAAVLEYKVDLGDLENLA